MSALLAKSARGAQQLTLFQHLHETEQAAATMFRAGTRWARTFTRFFKVEEADHASFLLHLRIAALFHDIGKANEDFQQAMVARGFKAQSLRHEHLSALLMCDAGVVAWLGHNCAIDQDVIVAAVLSHHLKASPDAGDWKVLTPRHASPTALLLDDVQVGAALARIAEVAGLPALAPTWPALRYSDPAWQIAVTVLDDRGAAFWSSLRNNAPRANLCLALKAGLIAADSVASGLWRERKDLHAWIEDVAHAPALRRDQIEAEILLPRQKELAHRWKGWHRFQDGAAAVGPRGLLLAGCGAGKTLAAWRWAQAVSQEREIGRVVFLYPTRGTATEGFRDYVAHAPEGTVALVHGTSPYELAGMMENPPDSLTGKSVRVDESEARLFSLGLWDKRFFSATVDQFLGFIEHSYGGLCLLPALADSAVVFDEIHSYDERMWNALVAFLSRFDVPVLCMTATLPPTRQAQLERDGNLRVYPSAADAADLGDLERAATHPRYLIQPVTRDSALDEAVAAVERGERVLWVVNTVRRCQQLARELQARLGTIPVGVYHSRFKLEDRQRHHRATIEAFRAPPDGAPPAAIAVTTQVCEMSLDLDADVLITEHAPISSLVQRFGRANRHLRRGEAFRARLLTYAPDRSVPYDAAELTAAARFLAELGGCEVSQRDLALGLAKHAPRGRFASGATAFTEGGFYAIAGALREEDDVAARALLDSDIGAFLADKQRRDGLLLSIPKKHARAHERSDLPRYLMLADAGRYDRWLGFLVDDPAEAT